MPGYGFSLTRIFPNNDRIRENTGQRKPIFWHILRRVIRCIQFKLHFESNSYKT